MIKILKSYLLSINSLGISVVTFIIQTYLIILVADRHVTDNYFYILAFPMAFNGLLSSIVTYKGPSYFKIGRKKDPSTNELNCGKIHKTIHSVAPIYFLFFLIYILSGTVNGNNYLLLGAPTTLIIWASVFIQYCCLCLSSYHNSNFNFKRPAYSQWFIPVCNLIGLILLFNYQNIIYFCISSLIGAISGFTFLVKGSCYKFSLFNNSKCHSIYSKAYFFILAFSPFYAQNLIDAFIIGSNSEGFLTSINYAQRIVIGVTNIIILGPSIYIGSAFASNATNKTYKECMAVWKNSLKIVSIVFLVIFAVCFTFIYYYHLYLTNKYTAINANLIIAIISVYSPGAFCLCIHVINIRYLTTNNLFWKSLALYGILWTSLYLIFMLNNDFIGNWKFAVPYSISWIIVSLLSSKKTYSDIRQKSKHEQNISSL